MKKKGIFFFTIIFTLMVHSLFSTPFEMILTGDPVLEDMRFLSLESGSPFLSFTPPLAPGEVRKFLDSINEDELSTSAREAYYRVLARLAPGSPISFSNENLSFLLDINAVLESRGRFNSDISWYPRYPNITPLVSVPLRASFVSTIQLYFEPIFSIVAGAQDKSTFNLNVPFWFGKLNHEMSVRAFAAAGGNWWNFQIGRDRLFWGTGHTGSLSFSDNSPYFDFARLSFFSSTVKYSLVINQLPLRLSPGLISNEWQPDNEASIDSTRTTLQRYFYLHRLDFKFFNRVSFGIMEGMLVGDSPFELRYLNPMLFFHSLWAWNDFPRWEPNNGDMVGSFASIELNWNIIPSFSIYGQAVMNEFGLPGEGDGHPNALGYMAGMQYSHSFLNWGSVSFLEFIYTDPYLSILSSPFASFIQMDRTGGNFYFIGYPRDTIAVTLGTNFFNRNTLNFSGRFSWIASGQHNKNNEITNGLNWDWERGQEAMDKRTPSGTAENKFVLSAGSTWRPYNWLFLKADITGIVSLNNKHISGNNQIGGQASFSVGFKY